MFQCSCDGFIEVHHRPEPKVPFCLLAAVVVMSASKGHSHGGKGGVDGHQGTQEKAEKLEYHGHKIHQPVREMAGRSSVAETHHHA